MTEEKKKPKRRGRKPTVAKEYYIDNREFYNELVEYFEDLKKDPDIVIPEALWIKFFKLTKRISMMPKFSNYTFKDEFINDALLLCAKKITRFNAEKFDNPFAFFTQIVTNSYWAFIGKEKKEGIKKKTLLVLYGEAERDDEYFHKFKPEYDEDNNLILLDADPFTKEEHKKYAMPGYSICDGGPKYGF